MNESLADLVKRLREFAAADETLRGSEWGQNREDWERALVEAAPKLLGAAEAYLQLLPGDFGFGELRAENERLRAALRQIAFAEFETLTAVEALYCCQLDARTALATLEPKK